MDWKEFDPKLEQQQLVDGTPFGPDSEWKQQQLQTGWEHLLVEEAVVDLEQKLPLVMLLELGSDHLEREHDRLD